MEIWKPVKEFDSQYAISNYGRMKRISHGPHTRPGYILKPKTDKDGYQKYTFYCKKKRISRFAHYLVLSVFEQPRPHNCVCNHLNGIKSDNRMSNLEWVSVKVNNIHAIRILKKRIGEKHGNSKFSNEAVAEMRHLYKQGHKICDLARTFGMAYVTAQHILYGKTRKHG